MKTIFGMAAVAGMFFLGSCKKNDSTPDPVPPVVIKPDTLSTGWTKIVPDSSIVYSDIFFQNNTTGYALGSSVIKSTNGGATWNATAASVPGPVNLFVTNDSKLFITNNTNILYKSLDGGTTITNYTNGGGGITDIFFIDNLNGYYISTTGLYNTTDGGVTWNRVNTTGATFSTGYASLAFSSVNTGFLMTGGGYRSTGSSLTWAPLSFTGVQPSAGFYSIAITPNNTIYICNSGWEIFKSTDGGATFSLLKKFQSLTNTGFADVHFVDNNTGYVNTGGRIYKTADAGANWAVVVALGESILTEIHFTDATHGWACGSKGTILKFN